MKQEIIDFINQNEDLIDDNEWEIIYKKALNELNSYVGKFTEIMLQADIHPENYLKELPNNFLYGSNVKEFRIPDTVTKIGNDAFSDCNKLTNVIIGNSVKSIAASAFHTCTSLTSIKIPDSVINIFNHTFENCTNLTSVLISDSVRNIGYSAFFNCNSLTNVTMGKNVTDIHNYAFADCSSLTSITIPNSVTYIGDRAFDGCKDLNVTYMGTKEQWEKLTEGLFSDVNYTTCTCIDGVIKKSR